MSLRKWHERKGHLMIRLDRLKLVVVVVAGFLLIPAFSVFAADYRAGLSERKPLIVDRQAREIRLLGVLQPSAFEDGWFKQLPGYHAVIWKGGGAADEALLKAFASDTDVYDALVALGAKPGNNLTQAVWDERKNERSKAPETRVEGTPIEAFVWWEGLQQPLPLKELVNDPSGKGIDLRFGGNKALIPIWKSGCIICLQSCPGGKISNRNYTIRDYVKGRSTFTVNKSVVPRGRRQAVVILRLTKSQ